MRIGWLSLCAGALIACGGGSGGDDGADDELPSPYADDDESEGAEAPALSPEQVTSAAMVGMQTFVALQPDEVVDAFESLVALDAFEPDCPEDQEVAGEMGNTTMIWYSEGCTTSAGLEFRGGGRFERFTSDEDGRAAEGVALSGDGGTMRLLADDGRSFEMTGYLYYERGTTAEYTDSYFEFDGQVSADDATAAGSPLMDGSLSVRGGLYSYQGGPYKAIGGSGSISGAVLGDARAFQFTNLLVVPGECASEPAGTFSVRDEAGFWHDVVFDTATLDPNGDDDPEFDAALCDGCGAYLAAGEVLGEACVTEGDMASLIEWEDRPW